MAKYSIRIKIGFTTEIEPFNCYTFNMNELEYVDFQGFKCQKWAYSRLDIKNGTLKSLRTLNFLNTSFNFFFF